jgi:hypothetical protein
MKDPNDYPEPLRAALPYPLAELWTAEKKKRIEHHGCFAELRISTHKVTGLIYYDRQQWCHFD